MDLGDIIIPLILIGGAIVQWWSGRKSTPPETERQQPPPEDYRRSPQPEPSTNPDFDELMEALGQKNKKESSQENRIPPPPVPPALPRQEPVVVRRAIPEPPVYVPRAEPVAVTYTHITSHDDDLEKRFSQFSSFDIKEASDAEHLPQVALLTSKASQQNRWRQDLRSHSTLRKAMVLNEILQPPVAMR